MKNIDKCSLIIVNTLFLMFPLSLMLGNLLINLNIVLFFICAFIFYSKDIIKFKINWFDKIILIFFFYTLIPLIIDFYGLGWNCSVSNECNFKNEHFEKSIISKTLFFFRYLLLYLALRVLICQKILKVDWFCIACSICAAFVCFDIFFQFIFGKDVFGIVPYHSRHYSGIFGDELIAGGYLQKFALFSFFLPFVLNKKKYFKVSIQLIFFIIFIFGIILSGNRMPLVLFIFSFIVFLFLEKEMRKYIFIISITISLFLIFVHKTSLDFRNSIGSFYNHGTHLVQTLFTEDLTKEKLEVWNRPYVTEFYCFKHTWGKNPIFGGGIKSYRTIRGCNSHPHNYYFEILSELGLFGFSIILTFVFMILYKLFIKRIDPLHLSFKRIDTSVMPFFLIFFIEFFPFRTSGSFFSTTNASLIFVILAILVSLISKKKNPNY
jgi:O-antigen ligase